MNIKALHHWSFERESTGDSPHKGPVMQNVFPWNMLTCCSGDHFPLIFSSQFELDGNSILLSSKFKSSDQISTHDLTALSCVTICKDMMSGVMKPFSGEEVVCKESQIMRNKQFQN